MRYLTVLLFVLTFSFAATGAGGDDLRPPAAAQMSRSAKPADRGAPAPKDQSTKKAKPAKPGKKAPPPPPSAPPRLVLPEHLRDPLAAPPPADDAATLPSPPPQPAAGTAAPTVVQPFFTRELLPSTTGPAPERSDATSSGQATRPPMAGVRYFFLPGTALNLGYVPRSNLWSQATRPLGLLPPDLQREERFTIGLHVDF